MAGGFFAAFAGLCSCNESDVVESHSRIVRKSLVRKNRKSHCKELAVPVDSVLWNADHERFKRIKFVVLPRPQQQQHQPNNQMLPFELVRARDRQSLRVHELKSSDDSGDASILAKGDVLEYINHHKLTNQTKPRDALKRVAIEATSLDDNCVLRFASVNPVSWQRFNIACYGPPIGIEIISHGPEDIPVVTNVEDPTSRLRAGDVLVAVNGIDAVHLGFRRCVEMIENLDWKVLLTFHRVVTPSTVTSSRGTYSYSSMKEKKKFLSQSSIKIPSEWI